MTSQKEVRELLQLARRAGWIYVGVTGRNHHRIRWPATGQTLSVPGSPSFPLFNTYGDIARISGPIRGRNQPKRNRRSRKAAQ